MEDAQGDERSAVSPKSILPASATAAERTTPTETALPSDTKSQLKPYPVRWDIMILLLAVVGGSVDAVVIRAFDALPGAQTGNTVLLGVALAHAQLPLVITLTAALLGYLLGVAIGQLMILRHRGSWPWPSAVGSIQIVELTFLVALVVLWRQVGPNPGDAIKAILVAFSAIAMGIQSAALLDLPAAKPTTTYITGMLTTFMTHMIQFLDPATATPSDPINIWQLHQLSRLPVRGYMA